MTIKFRAWDKIDKKMIEWEDMYGIERMNNGNVAIHAIHQPPGDCYLYPKDIILMQYTTGKDKNDKEIYRYDIVKLGKFKGVIDWHESWFCWRINWWNHGSEMMNVNDCKKLEIIGNIFENKDIIGDRRGWDSESLAQAEYDNTLRQLFGESASLEEKRERK